MSKLLILVIVVGFTFPLFAANTCNRQVTQISLADKSSAAQDEITVTRDHHKKSKKTTQTRGKQ